MSDNNLLSHDYYEFMAYNALTPQTTIGSTPREVSAVQTDLWGYILHNGNAATSWVQIFFRKASEVVLGTTPPDLTIMLGASQSIALELRSPLRKIGSKGLTVAGTTAETGNSAATVTGEILFKKLG